MNQHDDTYWMRIALEEAKRAASSGEVPIGSVLVESGTLLAQAHNTREATHAITGHAEIQVLELAGRKLKTWRFPNATLYVTVEPCLMCVGAIIQAQIKRVVFGVKEPKTGSLVSNLNLHKIPNTPYLEVSEGILKEESEQLMKTFFGGKREQ